MSLKNGNTVERRMDLASLFCMIGRHGPAVALAVIAVVSVVAGFVLYRTVRGKRRKARAGGDGSPGEERDAGLVHTEDSVPEEPRSPTESTDVSDEGSSDDELKLRHHRSTAEQKPPPSPPYSSSSPSSLSSSSLPSPPSSPASPPSPSSSPASPPSPSSSPASPPSPASSPSSSPASPPSPPSPSSPSSPPSPSSPSSPPSPSSSPSSPPSPSSSPPSPPSPPPSPSSPPPEKDLLLVDSPAIEDEAAENSERETCTVAGVQEDEGEDDSRVELQLTDHQSCIEEEKVLPAECQEDVTADQDLYDEDDLQNVCCEQKLHMSENREPDDETTADTNQTESHLEEHIEDVCVSSVCFSRDPENPEDTSHSKHHSNDLLSPEEDVKNEEVEDDQVMAQQAEMVYSTSEPETNQSDVLSGQNTDQDHECAQTGEESQEDVQEDLLSSLPDVHFDGNMLQQHLQTEQNHGEGLTWNGEDDVGEGEVLSEGSGEVEGEESSPVLDKSAVLDVPASDLKEHIQSEKNQGSVDQEANLPSSQLEQCDEATAEESDQNDVCGLSSKPIDDVNEGLLDDLTNVGFDSSTQQQLQTELQTDLTANLEDGGVKDEILTSVEEEPEPEKTDGVCAATDFPELSSDFIPSVKDEAAPALDLNADPLSLDVSSVKEEIKSEWKEVSTAVALAEETLDKVMSSSYADQHSDPVDSKEPVDQMGDEPVPSTETSHPHSPSSFQDKQSDQNHADLPEVTAVINKPAVCQVQPSLEQSDLTWSSSGAGGESGVSSMTVSPDVESPMNECVSIPGNAELPVEDPQSEVQISLSAGDAALSVAKEDAAGLVLESCPRLALQPHSEPTDWTKDEFFSSNEDTFGHEVEDGYNRAVEQFLEVIAAEVKHDEEKKQTDVKAVETKKEGEKEEEDYEKTEISIMEATMDNNEWITDGNYQVLPWMNSSVPPFTQSHTKTEAVSREEHLHSSAPAEAPCTDAVIPLPVGEQTSTGSLQDESLDTSRKVVAVQPMPQNVSVVFQIHYHTQSPYQKVAVTGNQQELGNWKEFIPLERGEDGRWSSVVSLPADCHVEWKFVVVDKGAVCRWEECGNRLLDTGSVDQLLVHRWWGVL